MYGLLLYGLCRLALVLVFFHLRDEAQSSGPVMVQDGGRVLWCNTPDP